MTAWTAAIQNHDIQVQPGIWAQRAIQTEELTAEELALADVQATIKDTWVQTILGESGRRVVLK
jgi:hypothetical protein